MRPSLVITILLLLAAGWAAWFFREPIGRALGRSDPAKPGGPAHPERPRPRPDDYRALIEDAGRWRQDLAKRYHGANDADGRDKVLDETRGFLETLIPSMMRCWLGTPWDFNGTADKPGAGKIACGYFVSTVLRDCGFRVDRYLLAQQPSENILRTFLPRQSLVRRGGVPYDAFVTEASSMERGIYIIGLDTHVAFLVVNGGSFRFIHSSGSQPWCVVEEGPDEAAVLRSSNCRILGNLSADRKVLANWLLNEPIKVSGAR